MSELTYSRMGPGGRCSFQQLREAVAEATIGHREFAAVPHADQYPGHMMVTGINYNSLDRIVTAFVDEALAAQPPQPQREGVIDGDRPVAETRRRAQRIVEIANKHEGYDELALAKVPVTVLRAAAMVVNSVNLAPLLSTLPAAASVEAGRDPFNHVLSSLVAAISILRRAHEEHKEPRKVVASDKMFLQMLADYEKAVESGRNALTAGRIRHDG